MKRFFSFSIYSFAHFSLFLMEWVLLGFAIRLWRQSNTLAMIFLPIVVASLSYDNLILAMGSFIGEGKLLESLSMVRFLLHYLVIPLFIVIGVELAHSAGAAWANKPVRVLSWVVALGLAGVDISTNYIGLNLVAENFAGMLRYKVSNLSGPPVITIVVNLFMLLIGIGLRVRIKWPWLFVGTLVGLVGNAIPSSLVGPIVGSTSEFVMAVSLLLTEQQRQFILAKNAPEQQQIKPDSLPAF